MRRLVTIQRISKLEPIPDADKIEVATVKGWKVVVGKEEFKENDLVVYLEIDSFIPEPLPPELEFLSKAQRPKRMMVLGKGEILGQRLKTTKFRGQLSQGLILPLSILNGKKFLNDTRENPIYDFEEEQEVSELLGIIKYEPPVFACMSGEVKGSFPGFLPRTDEERIQNCLSVLDQHKGKKFYITSKLDGTSASFFKFENQFGVCSRNLELKEQDPDWFSRGQKENIYWKLVREFEIDKKLPEGYCIQGEIVGPGIQKNPLQLPAPKIYFYNVYNIKEGKYLNYLDAFKFIKDLGFEAVSVITDEFILNHTLDELLELANSKSPMNPSVLQEGIVIRPVIEETALINRTLQRLSFKVISNEYLLLNE